MNKLILTFFLATGAIFACSQTTRDIKSSNLDFENTTKGKKLPDNWFEWGSGYRLAIDTTVSHKGRNSVLLQPSENTEENSFGCIACAIPADFEAKDIELKAYMKLQEVKEPVGLMLRIDGKGGTIAFENMHARGVSGTSDWTEYTVKLEYPKGARTIYIGAILSGGGKLWVDDFELLLDGVDVTRARHAAVREQKAKLDREFDGGSGIGSFESGNKVNDLKMLGLVWGFLKYYHPDVAAGNHNWDYELFRVLPGIISCKDAAERDRIMLDWIGKLAPVRPQDKPSGEKGEIKMEPDLGWITGSGLSDELESALLKIKNAERTEDHYYVNFENQARNPDFTNEERYSGLRYPDTGYRILALYRYWNIIQYWYPYKYLIGEDWKNVLAEFIPKFTGAQDERQYTLATLELIARIHDTHANIWGNNPVISRFNGVNSAGINVVFAENKAVVSSFSSERIKAECGLNIGDVIHRVNGVPVDSIIKKRLRYTAASNYATQLRDIARILLRTNDTVIHADVQCENGPKSVTIRAYSPGHRWLYRENKPDTCFRMLEGNIAYIDNGILKRRYLSEIREKMKNTRGLIIDDRNYPTDFPIYLLSSYLMPEKKAIVKFSSGSVRTPGLFTFKDSVTSGNSSENYYKGKIVILVNEITQSSAEYHAMAYRAAPGAIVMGSTTAGADGNVSQIYLPGGILTMISGIGVCYPDGSDTQRKGIVPDIEVRPTIKGIREKRDEVLERAIAYIFGKQVPG